MKKSIIAVALLSSFSASAVTVEELASHFYTVSTSAAKNATDIAALQVGKAPVGVVERVEKVEIGVVEAKGIASDALGTAESAHDRIGAVVTEINYHTKAIIGNAMDIYKTNQEVAGVKDTAVKASESAANAIQGVADTNARVDGVEASVSVVEGKVVAAQATAAKAVKGVIANGAAIKDVTTRVDVVEVVADSAMKDAAKAQTTADRAEGKADMNAASITTVNGRVDTVEQDVSTITGRIEDNEVAFTSWAAQSTARADEIASGVANNSARLDKVEGDVAGLKSDVKSLGDKVGRVGAMAMAVGSLNYDGMASGGAVAVGTYNGKASIAAGAQFNVSDRSAANLQLAYDGKSVGAGAGYNFKW